MRSRLRQSDCRGHAAPSKVGALHQTVSQWALEHPDAIALATSDATVTYAELESTAGAWAAELAAAGSGADRYVPIVLRKGPEAVAALLAVLKTGAAYALLDPAWPAARLRDVIELLAPPLLIAGRDGVDGVTIPVWTPPGGVAAAPAEFRSPATDGRNPCCVFFTSGTTGRPKGVVTPHRAIARLFESGTFAHFGPDTVIPLGAPMPWDAFALELWGALLNGGVGVIVDEPYLSAQWLRGAIARHRVNTVWLTASLFNMIVDEDLGSFAGVAQLMIGGERLSPAHVRRFIDCYPTVSLLNGYGPVESTVFATTHRIELEDCDRPDGIPLGRPVPRTEIFVLDGSRPCLPGEVGEICIAGDGLALRYVGDPELTKARYPGLELDGRVVRIYRSGDLGTWGGDGVLHFRGRADRQLKVRGHRIEPAEIERQVERLLPTVRVCRVVSRLDGTGEPDGLIAFCIPERPGDPLEGALGTLRSALLPYHRPVAVVSVDKFPVTEHGKLNEAALRALLANYERAAGGISTSGAGPRGATEKEVAATFAAVLGRDAVPADVSFFELGGNSLAAGRVCSRLGARFGRSVPVSWLYGQPTVEALAGQLRSARARAAAPFSPDAADAVPLTPMQLVFLTRHLVDPSDLAARCLLVWRIEGDVDRAALESAIDDVHRRHEALRAIYLADPSPGVRPADTPAPRLEILPGQPSLRAATRAARAALLCPLRPLEGDVWRTVLAPVNKSRTSVFGCVIHHIAFDGKSEAVLADDLAFAYNRSVGAVVGSRSEPTTLRDAYRDHAERLNATDLVAHRGYLTEELAAVPEIAWPITATALAPGRPQHLTRMLDAEAVVRVDAAAASAGVTRFVVLLWCWARSLRDVTGCNDFAVGVPVAQRGATRLERALGCHITMLGIRMRGEALENGLAAVGECGRLVARAFEAQDVSFADVLELVASHRTTRPPLFQTLFALQDASAQLDLAGLKTAFLRQPYAGLPLEFHGELWPDEKGGLRLVASLRPDALDRATAVACAEGFCRYVESTDA